MKTLGNILKHKAVLLLLKMGFISFSVYYLYHYFNWNDIGHTVQGANTSYLLFSMVLYTLKMAVDAMRWQNINHNIGVFSNYKILLKHTIIAPLFDLILPVPQGEDFYRFMALTNNDKNTGHKLLLSVFLNRYIGFLAIALLLPFSVYFYYAKITESNTSIIRLILFVALLIAVALLLNKRVLKWIIFYAQKIKFFKKFRSDFEILTESLDAIYRQPGRYFVSLGYVFISQVLYAATVYFLILSVGIPQFTFLQLCITVPLIYIGALLPISIGGLGIKEGILITAMLYVGHSQKLAETVGLLHLSLILLFWIIALLIFAIDKAVK